MTMHPFLADGRSDHSPMRRLGSAGSGSLLDASGVPARAAAVGEWGPEVGGTAGPPSKGTAQTSNKTKTRVRSVSPVLTQSLAYAGLKQHEPRQKDKVKSGRSTSVDNVLQLVRSVSASSRVRWRRVDLGSVCRII
jgi:hypothetical protein